MNAEGVAPLLSPEWLQTTATGLPLLLIAFWAMFAIGALWRRAIWSARGAEIAGTAAALEGRVEAVWLGYRVDRPGLRVEWVGSFTGPVTRLERGQGWRRTRARQPGLLDRDAAVAWASGP